LTPPAAYCSFPDGTSSFILAIAYCLPLSPAFFYLLPLLLVIASSFPLQSAFLLAVRFYLKFHINFCL
jgi:hypothetical protein